MHNYPISVCMGSGSHVLWGGHVAGENAALGRFQVDYRAGKGDARLGAETPSQR